MMVTFTEAGIVSVGPPGGPDLIRPRPSDVDAYLSTVDRLATKVPATPCQ